MTCTTRAGCTPPERHRFADPEGPDGLRPDADRRRTSESPCWPPGWRRCRPPWPVTGESLLSSPPTGQGVRRPAGRQVRGTVRHLRGSRRHGVLQPGSPHGRTRTGAASLTAELTAGAAAAETRRMPSWPSSCATELRSLAPTKDAVGRERYALASRNFLGAVIDLEETYAWGWQEFLAIEAEMREVAERIAPGAGSGGRRRGPGRRPRVPDRSGCRRCRPGCRSCPTGRSADLAEGRTSTSRSRSGRSSAGSPRPAAGSGPTTPGRATTSRRPGRMWWAVEPGRTGVLHLAGDQRRLPRGRARPSSADRHRRVPQGCAERLSAADGRHLRARRGLGAVRRAIGA